jgi:four helix bundle protein
MKNDLLLRTKTFSINCWKFCFHVPKSREYNAYVNQLIRCSSSVGANYRASQRAKSTKDFIYKLKIVEEEADESLFWLELFEEVLPEQKQTIVPLQIEAKELVAIIVASIKKTKKKFE